MTYNLTNFTDSTNIFDFQVAVNQITGGWYAILFLFSLYIIILIAMKTYDTITAMLVASFIIMIIAALFVFLQLLSWVIFGVIFALMVVVIGFAVWKSD